ncbi:MAG: hypothetical protein H0V89_11465 [Deltaproteobacteria bacterium]|nr:hypothetical protein [Deltaproteobacteria bacterium]
MNPFALALLFPGTGGAPLPPLVLGGTTELALSATSGISPRLSGGLSVRRGAKTLGWDAGLRGGPDFGRLDSGAWLHTPLGPAGIGLRLGAIAAVDVWGNPWFGGSASAQAAMPLGDRTTASVSLGAEVVTGIYVEGSLGMTPLAVAGVRLDHALGDHWTIGAGAGWPHLVGLELATRR